MSETRIIIDSKERDPILCAIADERKHLAYMKAADKSMTYSYDIELYNYMWDRPMRGERKRWDDFIGSWVAGKVDRQCEAVDFLIVEWDVIAIELAAPADDEKRRKFMMKAENAKKHLARLALSIPVIIVSNVHETVAILKYLVKKRYLDHFDNRVHVAESDVSRSIIASLPGINVDYKMEGGHTRFDAIWDCVDPALLLVALGIDKWHKVAGVPKSTVEKIQNAILETIDD